MKIRNRDAMAGNSVNETQKQKIFRGPKTDKPKTEIILKGSTPQPIRNQISDDEDFYRNLKRENFRGIIIFGNRFSLNEWMTKYFDLLTKTLLASFNSAKGQFKFEWGAVLDVIVLAKGENMEKLRGMNFDWMAVEGTVDPAIQEEAMLYIRNKLA